MRLRVTLGTRELTVELPDLPGSPPLIDGDATAADLRRIQPGLYSVLLDGRSFEVTLDEGDATRVEVDGLTLELQVEDERRRAARAGAAGAGGAAGGAVTVGAPMPGRVVAVPVAVGDAVEKGQPVVVLEAMKMESALAAPLAGHVAEVLVSPGQTVQQRQALVRIEG